MKFSKLIFALSACMFLFASCSNDTDEIVDNNVKVKKVLGVGTQISKTRTSIVNLDLTGHSTQDVHWSTTDKLSVFAQGHEMGDVFSWKSWDAGGLLHNIANFEGYSYDGAENYYVLYPAQPNARLISTADGPRLKFNIPNIQHAVKNSFDPAADIQAVKASSLTSNTVGLNNACAFFYITLAPGYSQVDISVADNTDWHLAGTVTAEVTSGGVLIKGFESDCTNEIQLFDTEEGGTYFIAFIPTSGFKNKLNLSLHKSNAGGVITYDFEKASDGLSFTVGNYYNLGSY